MDGVDVEGLRSSLDGTVFAVLFGSHMQGTVTESSDVDIAVRFPDGMDEYEQFRHRNRLDAELQAYADAPVDVSDIETLPTPVAYTALRDGWLLAGDEDAARSYYEHVTAEYESSERERTEERRRFIDRLARGDI